MRDVTVSFVQQRAHATDLFKLIKACVPRECTDQQLSGFDAEVVQFGDPVNVNQNVRACKAKVEQRHEALTAG